VPKVSVIIPNFNHARFLDRRIQSVLNQTFQDFEVIYLDDASSDNSDEILQKYSSDSRIRVINNQTNSGSTFKQWNKGVDEAQGEYIWIAEADDYADERLLEKLIEQLENNPEVGVAYCQSMCVDEDDNLLSTMEWWTNDLDAVRWNHDFQNNGRDECSRYLVRKNTIPNASAVLFRKAVYLEAGRADETMKVCGDWLCWSKCLISSDLVYVAEPLNFFRKHSRSVSHQKQGTGLLCLESYRVMHFIKRHCSVDDVAMQKACERMRKQWKSIAFGQGSLVHWKRNLQIFLIARRVDPVLDGKLVETIRKLILRR
jgi:glycosyltransferase involved in cell wall biosynthesis